jgi:hypothetical protein
MLVGTSRTRIHVWNHKEGRLLQQPPRQPVMRVHQAQQVSLQPELRHGLSWVLPAYGPHLQGSRADGDHVDVAAIWHHTITLHRIVLHHTTSYHITPHYITSHHLCTIPFKYSMHVLLLHHLVTYLSSIPLNVRYTAHWWHT